MKTNLDLQRSLATTLILSLFAVGACTGRDSANQQASSELDPKALAEREANLELREKEIAAKEEATRRAAEIEARERELDTRERALAAERLAQTPRPAPPAPAPRAPEPRAPESRPDPEPRHEEPAPRVAEPRYANVPAGTGLEIEFLDGVSSAVSGPGDRFAARVTRNVVVGGEVAIPAGSKIRGTVTEAVSLKKIGGRARLGLDFSELVLPAGGSVPIAANFATVGKNETGRDAATIGGSAAGGAVLGRATASKKDRDRNTVLGAIVGAAIGTAVASRTEGQEVSIPAGTVIDIVLDSPVEVRLRG